jgi:uncharacterized protein (TIRG00374 family)
MKWWKWTLAAGLAIVCLAIVISRVHFSEFVAILDRVNLLFAVAGFGVALVTYLLKALRFKILLGRAAGFWKLFGVTVAQIIIAQLIPARAGDVSYVVMVKKAKMASVGYGIASLVLCRIVDLVILVAMYVWSLWMLDLSEPILRTLAYVVGAGAVIGVLGVLALVLFGSHAVDEAQRLLERTRLLRFRWARYLWDELVDAIPHLKKLRLVRHILPMLAVSGLVWIATAGWIYLIWAAVGVSLTVPQLLFIFTLANILGLFPLFIFGGIGTMELVNWRVLISAVGIAGPQAASFTLCNRVLGVLYQVGLVLIVMAVLGPALLRPNRAGEVAGESEKEDRG